CSWLRDPQSESCRMTRSLPASCPPAQNPFQAPCTSPPPASRLRLAAAWLSPLDALLVHRRRCRDCSKLRAGPCLAPASPRLSAGSLARSVSLQLNQSRGGHSHPSLWSLPAPAHIP